MNKILFLALLVGGVALFVYGISASNSVGSDFPRFVAVSPTDRSIWLPILGIVAAVIGGGGLMRQSRLS